jgi:hypothetical protein
MDNPRASASLSPLQALTGQEVEVDETLLQSVVKFDGFTLRPGQSIYSPNWKQQLVMQVDGNLVFYKLNEDGSEGKVIWASNTNQDWTGGAYAVFQTDGNLVVYIDGVETETKPLALWASFTDQTGTDNYGKGILCNLPDVGQMRIVVQKTNSSEIRSYSPFPTPSDPRGVDGRFTDHLTVTNSEYYLFMDGKISLYTNQYIMFGDLYEDKKQLKLIMQADHNLVLYSIYNEDGSQQELLWTSNTGGTGADRAVFLDTGNLVVYSVRYDGGNPTWQSEWESGTDLAGTENYGQGSDFVVTVNDGYWSHRMFMLVRKDYSHHRVYNALVSGDKFRWNGM